MRVRKYINHFMAKLGYVRAPAKMAPCSIPVNIEVDSSQVREALPLLEQMTASALAAEAALAKLWNIQAAMQNHHPYTGAGGVSDSSGANGAMSTCVLEDEMRRRGVLRDTHLDSA